MRKPSIHILKSDLGKVLNKVGIKCSNELLNTIMLEAAPYSISYRTTVTIDKKGVKKAASVMRQKPLVGVNEFENLLTMIRINLGHKGVAAITHEQTAQYNALVAITNLCNEFLQAFALGKPHAKFYIEEGIKFMGRNYGLQKFKFYHEKIKDSYRSQQVIANDANASGTMAIQEIYSEIAAKVLSNVFPEIKENIKRVHFVYARQDADMMKADYRHWVTAQFDAFAFMNLLPELGALHGEEAKNRYVKFMYKMKKQDAAENGSTEDTGVTSTGAYGEYLDALKASMQK